jgi:hypothetical protein
VLSDLKVALAFSSADAGLKASVANQIMTVPKFACDTPKPGRRVYDEICTFESALLLDSDETPGSQRAPAMA